ncbi:MAG: tetratricopeptide repeat protein [Gemmatimonadetes bacterium]|uniref:Tetratricopeptide repeat protein n=1 Tax=Candidatus Kutchimonas denitrificans TaxID=3056748 RepID=A0AAE4Z899_9BACT|nr:tetratricopeptide repeat protein [Gemmatimonadota bacterium]NIR75654.1 tetratricopeptide repeat protein [Candidatus Kutchimonas denitrificans]NIR99633.1 tetratricopeptide repeat protein [Gemmatimonadota bacterium]NIT65908.1 tetratricopeptide repeat protein [Gemmatimonadota bacterium]NIV22077.1 tetratricopeptide repeat protein [Gemmatimonadota bacterium]
MRSMFPLLGLLALVGPATVAQGQVSDEAVPDSVTPERVLAGSNTFNSGTCVFCHAIAGRGSGRWAPDLSDAEWLHSEGDFNGIFRTIYWGVEEDEFRAMTPRRFEMHPQGGMSVDWEQTKELAAYVWTIGHPGTHPLVAAQSRFLELVRAGEVDRALDLFHRMQRDDPEHLLLPERSLNRLGYEFMPERAEIAQRIFQLNVELFPDSWNVYDSLAESYMVQGDREKAIELYEKSLELNPQNENGLEKLRELGAR